MTADDSTSLELTEIYETIEAGHIWSFSVTASNSLGWGEASDAVLLFTKPSWNGIDLPQIVLGDTNDFIKISWLRPNDGGYNQLSYYVDLLNQNFYTYHPDTYCQIENSID